MSDPKVLFIAPWFSEALFAATLTALDEDPQPQPQPLFEDMACAKFADASHWEEWTLDTEVAAIELVRQRSGAEPLHLVGYSGGGAAALAHAVAHPDLVASLCLIEPPWIGNDIWSEEQRAFHEAYERLANVPSEHAWDKIAAMLNAPTTAVPPAPPVPPDRIKSSFVEVWRGYRAAPLDRGRLREIQAPVYLPVGQGSSPRMHAQAELLASCFPSAEAQVYERASHFDLPTVGARQLAEGLVRLWRRSS